MKMIIKHKYKLFLCWVLFFCVQSSGAQVIQAPAYPLITHSPYFSIWSFGDKLAASPTVHWTGSPQSLIGMIKIDGKSYRFLGKQPETYNTVLSTEEEEAYPVKYSETQPEGKWFTPTYDDKNWQTGRAPICNFEGMAGAMWKTRDIWIRRSFTIHELDGKKQLFLKLKHDDGAEIFINGEQVYQRNGGTNYRMIEISKDKLKEGENMLAMHVVNTGGGAFADAGIWEKNELSVPDVEEAMQKERVVSATQTRYQFTCGAVDLELTFTSPLLLDDLELMSRPISYISYAVNSNDRKEHKVSLLFSASTDIAVNSSAQKVLAVQYEIPGLSVLKAGTVEQPVLKKKGDDLRIDWGNVYIGSSAKDGVHQYITEQKDAIDAFVKDVGQATTSFTGKSMSLSTVLDLGTVEVEERTGFIEIGYDEHYSIQYFHQNLRPWWNKDGKQTFEALMINAADEYKQIKTKCDQFDQHLYSKAVKTGGTNYASLCVLAYRQSIAAHQLVESPQGDLLWLSKENYSNGSIATVDITYPSAPLFLLYNPKLVEGMMNGIFDYSESGQWTKNFPAHDLGKYPIANKQLYGEDMPVEEAGNMLILTAAIAKSEASAEYAAKHWEVLSTWANYLLENGLDPANQLCTDDFAGHSAHNVNLSVKAILGIASFGDLARQLEKNELADNYLTKARQMAAQWVEMANDGDHFRLAFDQPGTWSQKYNLVWDKLLNLNIFPREVFEKETSYYLTRQNKYGLPLDSRKSYSKSDWIIWTATLCQDKKEFQAFIDPLYLFLSDTPDRVPMTDWYETTNARKVGFQARSVVGGYFIKLLESKLNQE